MDLSQTLLESWRRQCACIDNLATLMNDDLLRAKPSGDGWDLAYHLCHVHSTRMYWLEMASGQEEWPGIEYLIDYNANPRTHSYDLSKIRNQLKASQDAAAMWLAGSLSQDGPAGAYDHPVFYLQHMIWHEGWHAGLIMLGLRLAGSEPPEEWEDPNLWGNWRNYG